MPNNNFRVSIPSEWSTTFDESPAMTEQEYRQLTEVQVDPNLRPGAVYFTTPEPPTPRRGYSEVSEYVSNEKFTNVALELEKQITALQKTLEDQNNTIEYLKEVFEQMLEEKKL